MKIHRTITSGAIAAFLMGTLLAISAPADSVLAQAPCPANPSNVVTLPSYSITAVACGLNFPTAMTFYQDTIWVTEEGTATSPAAVKQIDNMGNVTTKLTASDLATGTIVSPLTGIVFGRGWFWLIHRQSNSTGAPGVPVGVISRFRPNDPKGTFQTFIAGFPSFGDHPNSQIVFGDNGRAYINGAAPTNSSVVGPDNGWAPSTPTLHDFPGVDVELSGIGYQTLIGPTPTWALDPNGGKPAAKTTYPFVAFGAPLPAGNKVKAPTPTNPIDGIIAGGGTVYSFDPDAKDPTSTMRLVAWGLRNPYGIGFDPFNPKLLFVSNNGADVRQTCLATPNGPPSMQCPGGTTLVVRGSRPIANDLDDLFVVNIGEDRDADDADEDRDSQGKGRAGHIPFFFGHPDYFHDPISRQPLPVTNPQFCPAPLPLPNPPAPPPFVLQRQCPQFAFSDRFRATLKVQSAFAEIEKNSSANMFDFSRTKAFGFKGDIFIAETGSLPPGTGATSLTGYKVARIDRKTGVVSDFIAHPSNDRVTIFAPAGVNKPIDVHFRGREMFVVDFGVGAGAPMQIPNSGKIWKVTNLVKQAGDHEGNEVDGEH